MRLTIDANAAIVGGGAGSVIQSLRREAAFATRLRMAGVDVERSLGIATVDVSVGGKTAGRPV